MPQLYVGPEIEIVAMPVTHATVLAPLASLVFASHSFAAVIYGTGELTSLTPENSILGIPVGSPAEFRLEYDESNTNVNDNGDTYYFTSPIATTLDPPVNATLTFSVGGYSWTFGGGAIILNDRVNQFFAFTSGGFSIPYRPSFGHVVPIAGDGARLEWMLQFVAPADGSVIFDPSFLPSRPDEMDFSEVEIAHLMFQMSPGLFQVPRQGHAIGITLDPSSLVFVPEPTMLAYFGLGIGVFLRRHRTNLRHSPTKEQ